MLHGAASVEAKSLDIGAVLEERHPFAVPRYQRAYAWDDEALGYFVRDVEAMLTSGLESSSHFFGGIVCIEHIDNQRIRPLSYEVVDGQQRLATFMLALSCVIEIAADQEREYLNSDQVASRQAATLRVDTDERYVTWKDADVAAGTTIVRPRLSLSLADDFIFQSLVGRKALPATTRESHELLVAARVELREMALRHVDVAKSPVERVQRLFRLRQALVHNAHIIHVVSRERLQAYRLFSVLNHRGESLSDADLLRSRSLELLAAFPDEHEQVARLWDEMLSFPAKSVEAFVRALYPSWKGERSKGDLFESVESAFLPDAVGSREQADKVVQFVAMLRDELGVFLRLLDGSWPYDRTPDAVPDVKAWQIARLRRLTVTLKHELCLPVLLAGARTLTGAMFAELVYMLEIFAFRYKIVCNGHASRPATLYYQQALKMRDAAESGDRYTLGEFRRELRQLVARHAGDQLFKQLLAENLRYSNRS